MPLASHGASVTTIPARKRKGCRVLESCGLALESSATSPEKDGSVLMAGFCNRDGDVCGEAVSIACYHRLDLSNDLLRWSVYLLVGRCGVIDFHSLSQIDWSIPRERHPTSRQQARFSIR